MHLKIKGLELTVEVERSVDPTLCVCGHTMHKLAGKHACWQHETGKCRCTEYRARDGREFDADYERGGRRIVSR